MGNEGEMTPEQLSNVVELALYRIGDQWRADEHSPDRRLIGQAIREVAEEMSKILATRADR